MTTITISIFVTTKTKSILSKYSLNTKNDFPTQKKSIQRELNNENMNVIEKWFEKNEITIKLDADTEERMTRAKRLIYIWKECFAITIRDIRATNFIEHSIDLISNAKSIRDTLPKYTFKKREFANRIFSKLENADIIVRKSSPWGAKTKFPFKKKKSKLLRVIHNFILINKYTIKSTYSMHHMKKIIAILLKLKFSIYFCSNAANGYWAISIKKNDENKTEFIISSDQWIYLKMNQNLKGNPFIYAQFSDLIFDSLSPNDADVTRIITMIDDHDELTFAIFMNDHETSTTDYEILFNFLHTQYFLRCVFDSVYLSDPKTYLFSNKLDLLEFEENAKSLKPALKHRNKILNWSVSKNREKLNAFLWLTPFLRIFISGRAKLMLEMKKIYLMLMSNELKPKKNHDAEMKSCDENLIKPHRTSRVKRPIIQRKYVEKNIFDWKANQQKAFESIKKTIANNVMTKTDSASQFHLITNASETKLRACLFQLQDIETKVETISKLLTHERMLMFLSYRLNDAETRYSNSERECYVIVKNLAEIRWLVMSNKFPVMMYTDHETLKPMFATGQTEKERIASWLDMSREYDWRR